MSASWPAEATRFLALRLSPGDDLKASLVTAFDAKERLSGFVVTCVGSLSRATLRYAGREEASVTDGPTEIVALCGTFSPDGCHLHAAISDTDGRMIGGHVLEGCVVRTTAEVVIGLTDAVTFSRPIDPATGYGELSITPSDR